MILCNHHQYLFPELSYHPQYKVCVKIGTHKPVVLHSPYPWSLLTSVILSVLVKAIILYNKARCGSVSQHLGG